MVSSSLPSFPSLLQRYAPFFSSDGTFRERFERVYHLLQSQDDTFRLAPSYSRAEHSLESADLLLLFFQDADALFATLLQHLLSKDPSSLPSIEHACGPTVATMVSRLHLLSHLYTSEKKRSLEDQKNMLMTLCDDPRILFIFLISSCVLTEHHSAFSTAFQSRLCRFALELFSPLSARLGMYALKYRFEHAAFPRVYPADFERLSLQLSTLREEYGVFIYQTAEAIRTFLLENGVDVRIMAREKQPFSVFMKLRQRSMNDPREIVDLFAIRVITDSLENCYQTLGLLHRLGSPLHHRFRDYISFPKPNGYQSLHTCLHNLPHAPSEALIEVQIRTEDMHHDAEYGVAAHWKYKENVSSGQSISSILSSQLSLEDDQKKRFADHIYVLTPSGDIVELAKGSTPLDFAFHIHSDLGLKYRMALVNGHPVSLSHLLENGDTVTIETQKHPMPSLQWLSIVRTPSAKSKLKHYFASHSRTDLIAQGKDITNAELRSRGLPLLDADYTVLATFDGIPLSLREREDLLLKIGLGSTRVSSVLRHSIALPARKNSVSLVVPSVPESSNSSILITGVTGSMPYRFAKCCSPELQNTKPLLRGIVGRSGTILVHDESCHMGKSAHPHRHIAVTWNGES